MEQDLYEPRSISSVPGFSTGTSPGEARMWPFLGQFPMIRGLVFEFREERDHPCPFLRILFRFRRVDQDCFLLPLDVG
jgi:hypothetical protein